MQTQKDIKQLSVLMTVFNESEFVKYAIKAALPYVDNIVIVEGSYQETINCGAKTRSTDGTLEVIQNYAKKNKKIEVIQANENSDPQQRNVGLKRIKELNPDGWLLIIDGDEIYTKENFDMVRNFMKLMDRQGKKAAYFKSLTFVNDFNHFTEQDFPRLFKITPECLFVSDNYMEWEDAKWTTQHVLRLPYLRYHHYAFCKSNKERFRLKKKWWETRFKETFEYDWYEDENGKLYSPNHKLIYYTGKHPEILKTHFLYPKEESENCIK